jgi:hypothetical protein
VSPADESSKDSTKESKKRVMELELQLAELRGKYLPFLLEGKGLATYDQLPQSDRDSYTLVKSRLLTAYTMSASTAYARSTSAVFGGGSSQGRMDL